jgi:hypothetical protein
LQAQHLQDMLWTFTLLKKTCEILRFEPFPSHQWEGLPVFCLETLSFWKVRAQKWTTSFACILRKCVYLTSWMWRPNPVCCRAAHFCPVPTKTTGWPSMWQHSGGLST